jgi:catechol 2,3-dioxygenase-like lactoylglutathione lyase family enzyme
MKLNHINLVVSNVENAVQFFEKYFDFKCTEIKGNHIAAILKGPEDFTLVILKNKEGRTIYPDSFHIGFMLDSVEQVMDVYHKLKSGGVVVDQEPKKIRDSFGFYFNFENLMIEVGHYYFTTG